MGIFLGRAFRCMVAARFPWRVPGGWARWIQAALNGTFWQLGVGAPSGGSGESCQYVRRGSFWQLGVGAASGSLSFP